MSIDGLRQMGFDVPAFRNPYSLQALIAVNGSDGLAEVDEYYASQVIGTTTLADVIAEGGTLAIQKPASGEDAAAVNREVHGAATIVDLGPYPAALIWGVALERDGGNPFHVYWSDGTYDWGLITGAPTPEQALTIAASI